MTGDGKRYGLPPRMSLATTGKFLRLPICAVLGGLVAGELPAAAWPALLHVDRDRLLVLMAEPVARADLDCRAGEGRPE